MSYLQIQNANASFKPDYVPVMVITGATHGIGRSIVEIFAKYQLGKAHIVLIGRNEAAAANIIANLPAAAQGCTYEFMYCDLKLMKNVRKLAATLLQKLPKINFLIHSAGTLYFGGRVETEEGIDEQLAVLYYSRFVLLHELMPLLRKARDAGEKAGVLAILGAGIAPDIVIDDLGMKKNYSGWKAMMQSAAYNDLMIAEFASREEGIAFVHAYPGMVDTYIPGSLLMKIFVVLAKPIIMLSFTKKEVCAEYMLYSLLDSKPGLSRRDSRGKDIGMEGFPPTEGARETLWEHAVKETKVNTP
ncbi:hypothetical protein CVT24_001331 [Panaeolus cyanescens]|uniref:Ketoreductase (KR) domain-containing protein n=1 Tax=Panaeolus cyanescens TaxID=181874 RepID=A0A409W745_9AGAR|nr:hypothetical protein CVT24_001331 [Panaeolus cyanescens]